MGNCHCLDIRHWAHMVKAGMDSLFQDVVHLKLNFELIISGDILQIMRFKNRFLFTYIEYDCIR